MYWNCDNMQLGHYLQAIRLMAGASAGHGLLMTTLGYKLKLRC